MFFQFQRGQLYTVSEASKEATTGQTAIEILTNEPYDDPIMGKGQYTHKIYHIAGYKWCAVNQNLIDFVVAAQKLSKQLHQHQLWKLKKEPGMRILIAKQV